MRLHMNYPHSELLRNSKEPIHLSDQRTLQRIRFNIHLGPTEILPIRITGMRSDICCQRFCESQSLGHGRFVTGVPATGTVRAMTRVPARRLPPGVPANRA